jgi:hypothetical protein
MGDMGKGKELNRRVGENGKKEVSTSEADTWK